MWRRFEVTHFRLTVFRRNLSKFWGFPPPTFLVVDEKNFEIYVICIYPTGNWYANFVAIREGTAEHYCVQFGGTRKFRVFTYIFNRQSQPLNNNCYR